MRATLPLTKWRRHQTLLLLFLLLLFLLYLEMRFVTPITARPKTISYATIDDDVGGAHS